MIADSTNFVARFLSLYWLTGPVFDKELRISSRRKRNYFLRFAYISLLTAFISFAWFVTTRISGSASLVYQISRMSQTGKYITTTIIWFQFIAIQLIAIVMLSNAISDEIYHRTLGLLMTTPISSFQIVIGKLFSKLLQLVLLLFISMPILAIVRVMGGVPWGYVVSSLCMTLTAAIFAGSVSMIFSINNRHTHSVIVRTIFVCLLFYIGPPVVAHLVQFAYQVRISLYYVNPFMALTYAGTRNILIPTSAAPIISWPLHCVIMLGLSAFLLAFSTLLIRKVGLRQATGQAGIFLTRRERRIANRNLNRKNSNEAGGWIKPVKGPPIIWKDLVNLWIKSSCLWAILTTILAVLILAFIYGYCGYMDWLGREETHIIFILIYFFFGLLRTATSAATSITSEKEAQTWSILLITPLTGRQIILGKIIGSCLGGWAFWLLLTAHIVVFRIAGCIPPAAILPLALLIVSSMLLVSTTGVFLSSCFKRSSISASINLILFLGFTAPVCCPSPLPTFLISPLFAAIMILGVTGGISGIEKSFQHVGHGWDWFGVFLISGFALVVLLAIYLSLALGVFAIAVTNIRRRSL